MALCPYCETQISVVGAVDISIGGRWNGVGYTCPQCSKILSVSVDPVSLKTDTVLEIQHHVDDALAPILNLLYQISNRLNQMR
jgi:hypothetical protein